MSVTNEPLTEIGILARWVEFHESELKRCQQRLAEARRDHREAVQRLLDQESIDPPSLGYRPGRGGHPPEYYEQFAERHKVLQLAGVRRPGKVIAAQLGLNPSTVRGHTAECRRRGLL